MRLSQATLSSLKAEIARPAYPRQDQKVGIVHFGIGAFHRAHQAVYADEAMNAGDRNWAILGVSLRSEDVAAQLNPQDGLFTISVRSGDGAAFRVIGAVQKVVTAPKNPQAVIEAVGAADTHILSFTITEKGYCRVPDGSLDPSLAGPASVYRYLREGLALRRDRGLDGVTLLSCDNLASNGLQLRRLLSEYLALHDPALWPWVEARCTFPCSMVDRIVPATSAADLAAAREALGLEDQAHVGTERFSQWVIEDQFAGPSPKWEQVGVELVADVKPYETAKLRMLNGAHSALAYIGLRSGHAFVHEAIGDAAIRPLIERLMRVDAAPSIAAASNQDLSAYADALLARFSNSALNHRLIQIAMDGSQKIPPRWLETLAFHATQGRQCPAILTGLGAWLLHVRGHVRPVEDPMAAALALAWVQHGAEGIVPALFGPAGLMASAWAPTSADEAFLAPLLAEDS